MRRLRARLAPGALLALLAAAVAAAVAAAPVRARGRGEAPDPVQRFRAAGVDFTPLRGWRLDALSRMPGLVYYAPVIDRGYRARLEAQLFQGPPPPDLDVALADRSLRLRQSRRGYVELGRTLQHSRRGVPYGLLECVFVEGGVRVHAWELLARAGDRGRLLLTVTVGEGAEARYEDRLTALADALVLAPPRS